MGWRERLYEMLRRSSGAPRKGGSVGGGLGNSIPAPHLEIEYDEPLTVECECCGAQETRLTRFVKRDGDAYAVYLVRFTEAHDVRKAYAMISLGAWWMDGVPPNRVAFALCISDAADGYQLQVIDANQLEWRKSEILGRKLNRDDALAHPLLTEAYQLFDHMVHNDGPLQAFVNGPQHPL